MPFVWGGSPYIVMMSVNQVVSNACLLIAMMCNGIVEFGLWTFIAFSLYCQLY